MRFERLVPSLVVSGAIVFAAVVLAAVALRTSADLRATIHMSAVNVQSSAISQARLDALTAELEKVVGEMKAQAAADESGDEDLWRRPGDAHWDSRVVTLGSSGFKASVGPFRFVGPGEDEIPDWYRIDVERRTATGSDVLFERDIGLHELPPGALGMRAEDIVTYDAETGTVTFELGERVETYVLPPR